MYCVCGTDVCALCGLRTGSVRGDQATPEAQERIKVLEETNRNLARQNHELWERVQKLERDLDP